MTNIVKSPTGTKRSCPGWHQEAALRMLCNNLDPAVAERPEDLVVYGGTGKAARNWDCFHAIVKSLKSLKNDETLLVQSGKPVGVLRTHPYCPRVLIANSNLVPHWANWDYFRQLEALGLIMYGQMTAGSWIYIGTQGILQGTYETFGACANKRFGGSLKGKWVLTGGMGGMGGAQPLSVTMNGGVILNVEVDPARIQKRLETGYCDVMRNSLDDALRLVKDCVAQGIPKSIGLVGNCADILPELVRRGAIPDVVTDQTSAHDELNGYVPHGISYSEALELRQKDPEVYKQRAYESMAVHMRAMLDMQKAGAVAFDYGNNLRGQAKAHGGVADAFEVPGFVPEYIRDLFCEGKGPFRWAALSGDPKDIAATDEAVLKLFPKNAHLKRWIEMARKKVHFQGLPARICWLGYGERDVAALRFNEMVASGELKAPIVIGRDHLDAGSVASPERETESMLDGSDAIADWPLLNALINTATGASWVSIHHGGGVGMGKSIHAGQVCVADGTALAARRLRRTLRADPGMGVVRHVDAGYPEALVAAEERGVRIPMPAVADGLG